MTTSTGSYKSPPLINRVVALLSNIYLISMVGYLILRLIFTDTTWWLAFLNAFAFYTFLPVFILLPLTFLLRIWKSVGRLSILALLGIIWFGPFFQPAHSLPSRGGTTLKIVTFNLWGSNNTDIDGTTEWLNDSEADIIVIQEPHPAIVNNLDYPEHIETNGLHLFSNYPVIESSQVDNQQRVVLDVNGQQIALYHIHFAYPLDRPPRFDLPLLNVISRYDETERNRQLEALLDYLKEEPLPYIVAGDFNMSQHSMVYSDLALVMSDSFRTTNSGLGVTWSTQTAFPMLRLDYIWHERTIRALKTEIGPVLGSDHLPMIAWLELPNE